VRLGPDDALTYWALEDEIPGLNEILDLVADADGAWCLVDGSSALFRRHPPAAEPELAAAVIRRLADAPLVASGALTTLADSWHPAVLGAAVRALAEARWSCRQRSQVERLLLLEGRWERVATADLAALAQAGFLDAPPCCAEEKDFAAALTHRLGGAAAADAD